MQVDLDDLADRLEEASEALEMTTHKLLPDGNAQIPGETMRTLSSLWHLSGRIAGMADALRIAARTQQEGGDA